MPTNGSCFDFFVAGPSEAGGEAEWAPWSAAVPPFVDDTGVRFESVMVPTVETTRLSTLGEALVRFGTPWMLVGGSARVKTALLHGLLVASDADGRYTRSHVAMSDQTTPEDTLAALFASGVSRQLPTAQARATAGGETGGGATYGVLGVAPGKSLLALLEGLDVAWLRADDPHPSC